MSTGDRTADKSWKNVTLLYAYVWMQAASGWRLEVHAAAESHSSPSHQQIATCRSKASDRHLCRYLTKFSIFRQISMIA